MMMVSYNVQTILGCRGRVDASILNPKSQSVCLLVFAICSVPGTDRLTATPVTPPRFTKQSWQIAGICLTKLFQKR